MNDKEMQDLREAFQSQHSIIKDLSRTVAGLQFSVLALAASVEKPTKILEEVEVLKQHLSTTMKINTPDLYTAVEYQLDLIVDRARERSTEKGGRT